jgi:protein TonB
VTASIAEPQFKIDPTERVVGPGAAELFRARWRFILLLCFFFLIHAVTILWLATRDDTDELVHPDTREVPIEVEVVPPPPEPPKPPPPKAEKQQQKPPPPPKVEEKPAFDAPKTATNPTKENEAKDTQTKAQTKAAPSQSSPTDIKPVPLQPTRDTPLAKETPSAPAAPDDKPDAEALDKAVPLPKNSPKPAPAPPKQARQRVTTPNAALDKTFAALEQPTPDFSVAKAAKPAIVGGGTEEATYNAVLLGLILKQQHMPPGAELHHQDAKVLIGFFIDERGNLTHQQLYRTSGLPGLDQAAIEAVRRAAPFPPPPPGIPHGFVAQLVFPAR